MPDKLKITQKVAFVYEIWDFSMSFFIFLPFQWVLKIFLWNIKKVQILFLENEYLIKDKHQV